MSKLRVRFCLQATKSFPGGAPSREEYETDLAHEIDCRKYSFEWLSEYDCHGCKSSDCPQCKEKGKP